MWDLFWSGGYTLEDLNLFEFEETPKISTYLYAVVAGPWQIHLGD